MTAHLAVQLQWPSRSSFQVRMATFLLCRLSLGVVDLLLSGYNTSSVVAGISL